MSGKWVVIEGIEGCGKGTLVTGLATSGLDYGQEVVWVREPGGTPLAEKLREILTLGMYGETLYPTAELLVFFASRVQLYQSVVIPALARGALVISERSYISSMMYQGFGNGQIPQVQTLIDMVTQDIPKPDLFLYLDIPYDVSIQRVDARGERDIIEDRPAEFFNRVRNGYLGWVRQGKDPITMIDATLSPAECLSAALQAISKLTVGA